jgi:hypothetical protein
MKSNRQGDDVRERVGHGLLEDVLHGEEVPRDPDVTVGQFHARGCEEQVAQAQAVSSESSDSTTSSVLGSVSLAVDSTLK